MSSTTFASNNQTVAGYTLIDRLGAGGYGEVWRAAAPGGLSKAVKIVYGNFGDARASRELKALDRIKDVRHPFLISLERIEVVDGRLIIVTELAEMSLKDRFLQCRSSGLAGIPRKELVAHLRDAADALDYMQERYSLQHMDVKPENLLMVGGRLKVADFGLVKDLHEAAMSMLDGMTPTYAAPELFNGTPSDKSDQYSLAVVYQDMLSGELPFAARTAAEWARMHITPSRKPNLEPLPIEDRRVVDRALARLPVDRFACCSDFVAALMGQNVDARERSGEAPRPEAAPPRPTLSAPRESECTLPVRIRPADGQTLDTDFSGSECDPPRGHELKHERGTSTVAPREQPAVKKLPTVESHPDRWRPAPTLFIGIGGAGCRIVTQLRSRLSQKFGRSTNYPAWGALLVDTDAQELQRAVHVEGHVSSADTLHIPLRSTKEYREVSQDLLRWISRRWLYNIPPERQTQGWRPLGRLAFVDHSEKFLERVRDRLTELVDAAALEQSGKCVGREFVTAPRVVLVASICGGAGSGSVLDAAYAVRQALQETNLAEARVMGVLTVSNTRDNAARELALANAYACLREFNYYASASRAYPGDECGLQAAPRGVPPFDQTYLLHFGQGLHTSEFDSQCELAAEYLFLDLATPLGEWLDACRAPSTADNATQSQHALRSFRLLPLTFPEPDLTAAVMPRLHKEITRHWCDEARAFPATATLEAALCRMPGGICRAALERTNRILGQKVGTEFLQLMGALAAHAQAEGGAGASAVEAALEALSRTLQAWRETIAEQPASPLLASDEAYVSALRTTLDEQFASFVPALARRLSMTATEWAARSLVAEKREGASSLDVLNNFMSKTSSMAHAEVQRVFAQTDVSQWMISALGDSKHAILCWRMFLDQSQPLALEVGGERYLTLLAPESPSNDLFREMLQNAFSEPTSLVTSPSPVIWLLQEAQQIGVLALADHLVGNVELYKEAAARLHTRTDVAWSEASDSLSV